MICPPRDPPIACVQYNPPDQSVTVVYPARRRAGLAYATTDAPFEQYPYLCMSHEIDVTPGTVRSNCRSSGSIPSWRRSAENKNPPKQLST